MLHPIETGTVVAASVGLFLSNPASWRVVGVGVAATIGFEYAYEKNIFGIQTGLDWAGEQLNNGFYAINRWENDAADGVGEPILVPLTGLIRFLKRL